MSSKRAASSTPPSPARAADRETRVDDVCRYGDIELDAQTRIARRGDRILRLSQTGLKLLAFFMGRPEVAHSRSQILGALGGDRDGDERTVDVYVGRLRAALSRGADVDPVRTIRGVGYALSYEDSAQPRRSRKGRRTGPQRHRTERPGALGCRRHRTQ